MSKILSKLGPVAKAVAAAVLGAVVPLLTAAAVTSAFSTLAVFLVPNKTAKKTTRAKTARSKG